MFHDPVVYLHHTGVLKVQGKSMQNTAYYIIYLYLRDTFKVFDLIL